ncbi:PEGA domain-containing protein [Massilia sp. Dwa41.01b]|uniref:PEGA domain-containing protein n=1 Tax=Massilia sp. Dwa41.01b TaxID=2709302 RepID=UPI0015FFA105|nr:PEGA domain-containing protein [Massilia sp. Dwa41.01b]QNA89687.1 PEGA domain-containing protein [Massilia sp. Dwa41.01b]
MASPMPVDGVAAASAPAAAIPGGNGGAAANTPAATASPAVAGSAPVTTVLNTELAMLEDTSPSAAQKADARRPAAPVSASYKLRIKPWGTLYVDGKPRGVSPPLKQIVLTPGKHTIRVVNPGFPEYVTTIQVGKNKSGAIEHDFAAH